MAPTTALRATKDRKVTNDVTASGAPSVAGANSFGLLAGSDYSCPGATEVCSAICYAGKLEKIFKGARAIVESNYNLLKDADRPTMISLIDEMIMAFEAKCGKRGAQKIFRIHWDGDFFNAEYAEAWKAVIIRHPDTQFWAYTRSAFAVKILVNVPNLSLYFSADTANMQVAKAMRRTYGVKLAMLTETFAQGAEVMREITGNAGVACPELNGKLPMISPEGSACARCGQCVFGRNDIRFASKPNA